MIAELLQFCLSGVTVGAIYALIALGFALIYNVCGAVNFAQGEFVMIGGLTAAALVAAGAPLFLAALTAIVAGAAIGLLLERFAVAPARDAPPATLIIITIGASLFLRGVAQILYGRQLHRLPAFTGEASVSIAGATLTYQSLWALGGAAALFLAVHLLMQKTLIGAAIQATAANKLAAKLVGIDTRRIYALAFTLSGAIGAAGGVLITPITLARYDMGALLALKGFAAAVLGGMGSPGGAILGGLMIGLLEGLGAGYVSSTYKDGIAFVAMLLVLMFLPNGLLGARRVERV